MSEYPSHIAGEFAAPGEGRETAPKGRSCEICGATLSIYNDTNRCSVHKHSNILSGKAKRAKRKD